MTCNGWQQGRLQNSRSPPGYFRRGRGGKTSLLGNLVQALLFFKNIFWGVLILSIFPALEWSLHSHKVILWGVEVGSGPSLQPSVRVPPVDTAAKCHIRQRLPLTQCDKRGVGLLMWFNVCQRPGKGSTHERPGFEVEDIFLCSVAFGNWLCEKVL